MKNGLENISMKDFYSSRSFDELPLVSVIIPVFNVERYLKRALLSIKNQSYKKLEILCVNDGSTDGSVEILNAIKAGDDRIKVIDKQNGGPASARNAGLDAAKGKYISFVDSDDELDPLAYEQLVWQAETNDADIVVFGGKCFPKVDVPEWIENRMSPDDHVYEGDAVKYALFHEPSSRPFIWLHFLRRELIEREPKLRMNEAMDLGEDQFFQYCYFPRAKKVVFTKEQLYHYYWNNEGSIMWQHNLQKVSKFQKHLVLVDVTIKYWQDNRIDDPYGELVSWMIDLLYNDWNKFPAYLKIEFAKQIVEIIEHNNLYDVMRLCGDVKKQFGEIQAAAAIEIDTDKAIAEDIRMLTEEIDRVEGDIVATLKSKKYKIGKLLTKRWERVDEESVLPQDKKLN